MSILGVPVSRHSGKHSPPREQGFAKDTLAVHTQIQSPYYNQPHLNQGANLNAIFPFNANEMALRNSVVLGTRANNVNPRNFSSIVPDPRTTSTVSTKISTKSATNKGGRTRNNSVKNRGTKKNH